MADKSHLQLVFVIQEGDGLEHNDCVYVCGDEETAKAMAEERRAYHRGRDEHDSSIEVEIVKKAVLFGGPRG